MSDQPRKAQVEHASKLAEELRALVGRLKRKLREQKSHGDLTPSQVTVLLHLEKQGPATASNLARAEGMRPQSMGAVIAPLEATGLLRAMADPEDGRQTLLSLTEKCRKLIQDGRAARQDWLTKKIQAKLSPQEQEKVAAALKLLARLIED
jgi:DNA-binding MarR family transcriptional regulator